jgi:hypothetical protein
VTNGPEETAADVSRDTFIRLMVTNALSPMRVVETLQDLVTPNGTIGVMSSGQGSIANSRASPAQRPAIPIGARECRTLAPPRTAGAASGAASIGGWL